MRLVVSTPLATIVDTSDVVHVRAEDETGAFGVLQGHAGFITALAVSVLSWRKAKGAEHYVAVRGGMLEVRAESLVTVATPEAVEGEDLHVLESEVLARFRRRLDEEQAARTDARRLHVAAVRQLIRLLRPEQHGSMMAGPLPPSAGARGTTPSGKA